jgi:demethylspheroidene O-methyltransferase
MQSLDVAPVSAQGPTRPGWWDALREPIQRRLDGWFSDPALYRWAIANPLTRWVTRRRTAKLFELMAGFVHSQVLLSCVRLGLFARLKEQPLTLDALARHTQIEPPAMQRLLLSAVALGLLEHRSMGRFGLGPLGAPLARQDGIAAMIEHNNLLYQDLLQPVEFLRDAWGGSMAGYWPYAHGKMPGVPGAAQPAGSGLEPVARYSELMASSQNFVLQEILSSYALAGHRRLMDVGGGKGRFISAVARQYPALELTLFDLPPVLEVARSALHTAGLDGRVRLHPGSFLTDALPGGADVITLIRVAHDHCDASVRDILRNIYQALPKGGTLLVAEPMAQSAGERPQPSDAYFHYYLLAMGAGRLRTHEELAALMRDSGFAAVTLLDNAMPIHARILVGTKI